MHGMYLGYKSAANFGNRSIGIWCTEYTLYTHVHFGEHLIFLHINPLICSIVLRQAGLYKPVVVMVSDSLTSRAT